MRTSQQKKNVILIPRISIDLLLDFFTLIVYITINKRTVTMFCLLTKFVWGREKNWPENQNTAIMNHMSNETDEHWFIWLRWWLSFHVIHLNFSWVITFCHEIDYFGMYIISHRSFLITSCLGIFRLHANILLSLSLTLCQAKMIRHAEKCRPNNPWYPFSSIYKHNTNYIRYAITTGSKLL